MPVPVPVPVPVSVPVRPVEAERVLLLRQPPRQRAFPERGCSTASSLPGTVKA